MTNVQANNAVFEAVAGAVRDAVIEAVYRATDWDVHRAVSWAVWRAVSGAVRDARREDPDHPALEDFLRAVGGVR